MFRASLLSTLHHLLCPETTCIYQLHAPPVPCVDTLSDTRLNVCSSTQNVSRHDNPRSLALPFQAPRSVLLLRLVCHNVSGTVPRISASAHAHRSKSNSRGWRRNQLGQPLLPALLAPRPHHLLPDQFRRPADIRRCPYRIHSHRAGVRHLSGLPVLRPGPKSNAKDAQVLGPATQILGVEHRMDGPRP